MSITNCVENAISQTPSIFDIIQPLKTTFLESLFDNALQQLLARDNTFKQHFQDKCDAFDQLMTQKNVLEQQCSQLKIDCEINDQKIKDLTRDLCLFKDKLSEWETSQKDVIIEIADLRDQVRIFKGRLRVKLAKIEVLEGEKKRLNAHVEKMEEICKENVALKEEIGKVNAHMVKVKKDEEKRVNDVMEKLESEMKKVGGLEETVRMCSIRDEEITKKNGNLEEEIVELRRNDAVKCEKIAELLMKNEDLKEEIGKVNGHIVEVKRDEEKRVKDVTEKLESEMKKVEVLEETVRVCSIRDDEIRKKGSLEEEIVELRKNDAVKCEKIAELLMMNEILERDKGEVVTERDEKFYELKERKEIEDRLLKLEEDVLTCLCIDLKRDATFSSTKMGKILAEIERVFDSQGVGIPCKGLGIGALHTPLVSGAEKFRENKPTGFTGDNFVMLDSDDDNDNLVCISSVKSKCGLSDCLIENFDLDSPTVGNLDPKHKKMKINDVANEPVNQGSLTLSATRSDHKCRILQRRTVATI